MLLELDEQEEQKEQTEEARRSKRREKEETDIEQLDSGFTANGILEVLQDGYGSSVLTIIFREMEMSMLVPSQIRRFGLKQAISLTGNTRVKDAGRKVQCTSLCVYDQRDCARQRQ